MEHYLRFYIKFQSYVIAIGTILGSIFMANIIFTTWQYRFPLSEFYNFRFIGSAAIVIGVIWFAVGVSLFYGIFKEDKRFIYPFIPMFMLELFLLIVRDIVMIWQNTRWYDVVFMNPISIAVALYVVLHVMMTLVSIGKLIDHEPVAQAGTNFVRFQPDAVPEQTKDVGEDEETQAAQ